MRRCSIEIIDSPSPRLPAAVPANLSVPTAALNAPTVGGYALLKPGAWTNRPDSFAYQVRRAGAAVGAPLLGTSPYFGPSYVYAAADQGQAMTVDVVAVNIKGASSVQTIALGTPTYRGVSASSLHGALSTFTAGGAVLTQNAATAPDGTVTAGQLLATATTGGHNASSASVAKAASIIYYHRQVWAKPVNGYNVATRMDDGTSSNYITQIYDINTGVVKTTFAVGTGFSVVSAKITADPSVLGPGYYRCETVFRADASRTTIRDLVQLADAGFVVASFTGNAANGALIWQPQTVVQPTPATGPVGAVPQIVFDTALCTDDSFDAFYLTCKSADLGKCNLLAATVSNSVPTSASCLRAMLNFSGYPNIPIGAYKGSDRETADNYCALVTARFRPGDSRANYRSALVVARQALAGAADNSVTYICAGNLGNLYDLLLSAPDDYCSLSGYDLVALKVARLVLMGGNYPTGAEHNLQVLPNATQYVLANWPGEIVMIPFAIGTVFCRPPLGYDPNVNPYGYAFDNLPGAYYTSLNGVTSLGGAAGSGGTNGTFPLTAVGGGGTGFAGTFTVAGGVITQRKVLSPGQGFTSDPTFSTAASAGLTGGTVVPTRANYNARSAWDGVTAYTAIYGVDNTNLNWVGGLGLNVSDGAGNNTFTAQEPGDGLQQYLYYNGDGSVSIPALASEINSVVFG